MAISEYASWRREFGGKRNLQNSGAGGGTPDGRGPRSDEGVEGVDL